MKDKTIYKCKFCGKECVGLSGLHFHENRCKENPNAIKHIIHVKCCIVNNGISFKKIHLDELNEYIDKGWHRGYGTNTKVIGKSMLNKLWITNGINNKSINKNDNVPEGYHYGITFHSLNIGKCKDPLKEEQRKRKISETSRKNKKSGGYRIGSGHGKKGWYKGIFCDSTWELAYVIYCLDHDIKIERNKQMFDYEYNGEIRKYLPDFIVDNKLVEVKGWKDPKWLVKEKVFRNIKIIDKDEIQQYIDYVKSTYNCKELVDMYEYRNKKECLSD